MPTTAIRRFEDLTAWQKARDLTANVYRASTVSRFHRDAGLRDQIRRAAVSTMSNIAEGFERGTRKELHQFLVIAKASCAEVRSQLYVAKDVGYLKDQQFTTIMQQAEEVARIIGGLRKSIAPQKP